MATDETMRFANATVRASAVPQDDGTWWCVTFRFDRDTDDRRETAQPDQKAAQNWCLAALNLEVEVWE